MSSIDYYKNLSVDLRGQLEAYQRAAGHREPEEFASKDRIRTLEHNLLVTENRRLAAERDALRAFVQAIADEKTCNDAPSECCLDSGPYCGHHAYDTYRVVDARAILVALTPREAR